MLVVVAAVLVVPARAFAANVAISTLGFVPSALTINKGDSVTWTNTDIADHQVFSSKADFYSRVLSPGQSYSFVFNTTGSYAIGDELKKQFQGTINVKAVPAAPKPAPAAVSMTMSASTLQVVYGGHVMLSGTVSNKQSGEKVTVLAEAYGAKSFSPVATVTTTNGGSWGYSAKPTIQTGYQSRWNKATSSTATVGVHPLVSFHVLTGQRFSTKVVAAHSFAGRYVQLQRRSYLGQWVTIKRVKPDANSFAILRVGLSHGTSKLRIAFSVNQAGPGFLAGMSRTIVYSRG